MAFRKIIKDSEGGPKYVTEQEEELVFDQVPTQGSFNPVTSDGVANALSVTTDATLTGDGTTGNPLSVVVDNALDADSENPVQNKVLYGVIGDVETLLGDL